MKKFLIGFLAVVLFVSSGFLEQCILADTKEKTQEDFVIEKGVLKKYQGTEEHVVVPDGVITIQVSAFRNNPFIKSVSLPEG